MDRPVARSALLGAPVLLLVAEPWDFTSAYGRGRLQGHISNIRDFGPVGGQELEIEIAQLIVNGQAIHSLRATPLHAGAADLIQCLVDRRSAAVRVVSPPGSGLLGAGLRLAAAIRRVGASRPGSPP